MLDALHFDNRFTRELPADSQGTKKWRYHSRGGPLTDRLNTTLGAPDEALINAKLAPDLRNNRSTLERT